MGEPSQAEFGKEENVMASQAVKSDKSQSGGLVQQVQDDWQQIRWKPAEEGAEDAQRVNGGVLHPWTGKRFGKPKGKSPDSGKPSEKSTGLTAASRSRPEVASSTTASGATSMKTPEVGKVAKVKGSFGSQPEVSLFFERLHEYKTFILMSCAVLAVVSVWGYRPS